jgi:tetratricopeptide (TPR) repeat protein
MAVDKIEYLCQKAQSAIAQREWDKAKMTYLQALGLKSDIPDIHYGLATVYFQLRELTSAAHHFKEVTRLDPLRAGAYINLGAVLNLLNQPDEAVAALRRGIQLDGQRVEGYYNLGLVYRRKGQVDLAVQSYREALRINPRMADAHLNLANLFFEKQNYRLAITHYQNALQIRRTWDKALDGLDQAKAAHEAGQHGGQPEPEMTPIPGGKAMRPSEDLDRLIDPNIHHDFLNALHQATITTEDLGKEFEQVLEKEVEPAIKELSSCLLYPDGARMQLSDCVDQFEAAMQHMRTLQESLTATLNRVRKCNEEFPE